MSFSLFQYGKKGKWNRSYFDAICFYIHSTFTRHDIIHRKMIKPKAIIISMYMYQIIILPNGSTIKFHLMSYKIS